MERDVFSITRKSRFSGIEIGEYPRPGPIYIEYGGMLNLIFAALKNKPEMVHVILTGRNAHPSIVEVADTVTEMKEVKHAYTKGIEAQRGIEY